MAKLIGMNAEEEYDKNDISVQTYLYNFFRVVKPRDIDAPESWKRHLPHSAEYYAKIIEEIYQIVFDSVVPKKKPEDEIFHPGTLIHFSPIKNLKTGEIYYDKIESIGKHGLISADMMIKGPDAVDSTYVSFHSVLDGEETIDDSMKRIIGDNKEPGRVDHEFSTITFVIDSNNVGIQTLEKIGLSKTNPLRVERLSDTNEQTPDLDVLQALIGRQNSYIPDALGTDGVWYLPLGVPASYISAIYLPRSVENDPKLLQILFDNFPNAYIYNSNGKLIEPRQKGE